MSELRFRGLDGKDITPAEWLRVWAAEYPGAKYDSEHDTLIAKSRSLSSADFERIGRWKDAATADGKWKPNVASVAFRIWMQAATARPKCPNSARAGDFLLDWSERKYTDQFASRTVKKRFGLSRATTLLYFLSKGRFPIFDSRVRRAIIRLRGAPVPNTVSGYLSSYCPLFLDIAARCQTTDLRKVDQALFSYGGRR
jgi:hypothetical protein